MIHLEIKGFLKYSIIIVISLIIIIILAYSYQEYIIYPGQLRKYDNFYETFLNNRHNNAWTNGSVNPEEIFFTNEKGQDQTGYFIKPVLETVNPVLETVNPVLETVNPVLETVIETEVWIVIGGNGSLALDWITDVSHLRAEKHHTSKHGHLLIEYPGYGKSSGSPNTETIFKVIQKSINKILNHEQYKNIKLNFICHSLGCASCLYYIKNENDPNIINRIRKIILLAPFYTLKDVAVSKYYIPRMFADTLIRHKWDSHKNIKSLDKLTPEASLKIIHGSNDELIDISQGLLLFKEAPNSINKEFIETNDSHNSIAHLRHLISHDKDSFPKKKKMVKFAPELQIKFFDKSEII